MRQDGRGLKAGRLAFQGAERH